MCEHLGLFALYNQKPQTKDTMETDVMTEQEFKEMVERMRPRLMQMGREFFGSDTEAEEVVQETWLRVWNVRKRVTLTDAYVMRIARNCCVSMWRGQRDEVELIDDSSAAVTKVTPQEEMEERENSEWLQSRLQRLPKAEREVWQMFYDEGLTVEEIAEARGISVATVRNTISNVRSTLRTALRRRFFDLRHVLMLVFVALATGFIVAAILNPSFRFGSDKNQDNIEQQGDTTIYNMQEVMPSYPDGIDAYHEFLAQHFQYPKDALADSVEGRVIISVIVEKDGRLTNPKVLRSPDSRLTKEALRLISIVPRWNSSRIDDMNVRSRIALTFNFSLELRSLDFTKNSMREIRHDLYSK